MTFTTLGSGTHFPNPHKRSAGYLLRDGKSLILFDFGYGTLLRLVELEVRYQNIGHIFFTHTHEDHYLDLLPFLNTMYLQVAQWGLPRRIIRLFGPRGFKKKFQAMQAAMGRPTLHPYIDVQYRELAKARLKVGKFTVLSHSVRHMEDINALVFRIKGKHGDLAYTGDLDYDEGIIPFLKGVHTLVIECGFPNHMKKSGHLTPRECGLIARAAGAKRVVLTHRYPPCDRVDVRAQCRDTFGGRIMLARDTLTV